MSRQSTDLQLSVSSTQFYSSKLDRWRFSLSTLEPTAVTNLAAVATDFDSILVTWDLPLFPNGPISHYILYYIESDEVKEPPITSSGYASEQVDSPTTDLEITGLKPLTNYAFHVQPYGDPSLPGDIDEEVLQRTSAETGTEILIDYIQDRVIAVSMLFIPSVYSVQAEWRYWL